MGQFYFHAWKTFYINKISYIVKARGPVLYSLYKTVHILDYWLKYTDLVGNGQAILSGSSQYLSI
jgi:hypothetical protein